MMRRDVRTFTDLAHKEPITHAIKYVDPDGTTEVDFRQLEQQAARWADWCRRDGCTNVLVRPIYSEPEIAAVLQR
jgi:hypothetical protein